MFDLSPCFLASFFLQHGGHYVLLLVGGDKSTQARDIKKAKELACKYAE